MLSIHGVRAIHAHSLDSNWLELTFEGAEAPITLCIYAWTGASDDTWANQWVAALKRGIETLPPIVNLENQTS